MKQTVRTFIAVDLSPSVSDAAMKMIKKMQDKVDDVKWIDSENLHVTLKFIGEIPTLDIVELIRTVDRSVKSIEPFELEMLGLGAFPTADDPRTIWIGSGRGSQQIAELNQTIGSALETIGYPPERRGFQSHLTLGRARRGRTPSSVLTPLLQQNQDTPFGTTTIDCVTIYSSELHRQGPRYDVLSQCDFF